MKRDFIITGIIGVCMLLIVISTLLIITEQHNYTQRQRLAEGFVTQHTEMQDLSASWDEITAGTTIITVVHTTTQPSEETTANDDLSPIETITPANTEEPTEETNELTEVLDDLEKAFNYIDNFDDDVSDIKDAIADADDEDDLEDLEEDLDELEEDDFEDLEDFVNDIEDRFDELDYRDFEGYTEQDFEDIEDSIHNAKDNLEDSERYLSEAIDYLQQRYDEV